MKIICKTLKKISYELLIFGLLLFEMLLSIPSSSEMTDWLVTPYLLSYQYGIGKRFFIGSIVNLLTEYITYSFLWYFILFFVIVMCLLVSCLLGQIIRKCSSRVKGFVIAVVIIYLASPAAPSYLFNYANYGRLDMFLLLFSLLMLLLARRRYGRWLIPLLALCCMATHQVYTFTFFPLILIVLLYEVYRQNNKLGAIICLAATFFISCGAFIYLQFFSGATLTVSSAEEWVAILSTYSNVNASGSMLALEYFFSVLQQFSMVKAVIGSRITTIGVTFVMLLPLFAGFFIFWVKCLQHKDSRFLRFILILVLLAPLCSLPAFILTTDWARWTAVIICNQFCLMLYFLYRRETTIESTAENAYNWCCRHKLLCGIFIIYLVQLGTFRVTTVESTDLFTDRLLQLINYFKETLF